MRWRGTRAVAITIVMASHAGKVAIGLIQMSCAAEPRLNLDKAIAQNRGGRQARRADRMHCRSCSASQYPCQVEDPKFFDLAEPIPGPTTEALGAVAKARKIVIVASIFERRAAGVYHNTAVVIDEAGQNRRALPQDAYPRRPALLRKILLHPRRSRFRRASHRARLGRRARVLGSMVSRSGAPDRDGRRADSLLSDGHRMVAWRAGKSPPASRSNAWETMQRSHAIANGVFVAAVNRVGVEGELEFWGDSFVVRSVRRGDRARERHRRGNAGRRMRSRQDRGDPPQLAVSARPPHRRLRRPDAPLRSLAVTAISPEHRRILAGYRMPPNGSRISPATSHGRTISTPGPASSTPIPALYAEMVATIARFEPVRCWSPMRRRSTTCAR